MANEYKFQKDGFELLQLLKKARSNANFYMYFGFLMGVAAATVVFGGVMIFT